MTEYRLQPTYKSSFEAFLSNTNEKAILSQELINVIQTQNIHSLLDIGAGNGELASLVTPSLQRYVAIEQRADFVAKLKQLPHPNMEAHTASYPFPTEEKFDAVLFSHSIPTIVKENDKWKEFIDSSLEHLNQNGTLIIVTYEAGDSAWSELLKQANLPRKYDRIGQMQLLSDFLKDRGELEIKEVVTHVETKTIDEIIKSLSFVYSDGRVEREKAFLQSKEIRDIIEKSYKTESGYSFPFTHYLVTFKPNN
jgi:cyclopropane fatty-acyl-phospholipid synthase-like methyltransferase